MLALRKFPVREEKLCEEWAHVIETRDIWTIHSGVGSGESGSFHCIRDDGLHGIAKPAFQAGGVPRAAHEKIAADLAHLLEIPIPPVALWRQSTAELFAISAWAFPQTLTWAESAGVRTPLYDLNCRPALAAGLVFHSWIGDQDHNDHGGNLVVDANKDENEPALAFIDHAFSMSMSWSGLVPVSVLTNYYCSVADMPLSVIDATSAAITGLEKEKIAKIVNRIPADFLTRERATIIIDNLTERQGQIRSAFGF